MLCSRIRDVSFCLIISQRISFHFCNTTNPETFCETSLSLFFFFWIVWIALPRMTCVCTLSCFCHATLCDWLFVTLWTVAHQAPLSVGLILQTWILEWVAMPSSKRWHSHLELPPRKRNYELVCMRIQAFIFKAPHKCAAEKFLILQMTPSLCDYCFLTGSSGAICYSCYWGDSIAQPPLYPNCTESFVNYYFS